jgi:hypothetical protein
LILRIEILDRATKNFRGQIRTRDQKHNLGIGVSGWQKEEALSFLEKAYEERDGYNIAFIKADPFLDPLRGHPRFEALVQKIYDGE